MIFKATATRFIPIAGFCMGSIFRTVKQPVLIWDPQHELIPRSLLLILLEGN